MGSLDIRIPDISVRTYGPSGQTASRAAANQFTSVPFSDFFKEAVANVAGSDYIDKTTNVGLVTGTLDDLHTATIAAEKAEIMLNLTVQVRNRMIESYQEIMRMPM